MTERSCGAVIYKYIDNELFYLVTFDTEYGFPKGHMEKKETKLDTALREIREEVNLHLILKEGFEESISFELTSPKGRMKEVTYFLGTYENEEASLSDEVSEIKLLKYEDAMKIIKFDKLRNILYKANNFLMYN